MTHSKDHGFLTSISENTFLPDKVREFSELEHTNKLLEVQLPELTIKHVSAEIEALQDA